MLFGVLSKFEDVVAILVVPGISASIFWWECSNSPVLEFTPKTSCLKLFIRVSDWKAAISRESWSISIWLNADAMFSFVKIFEAFSSPASHQP